MADRLLALAGPGNGPTISTKNLREPTVHIMGLISGSVAIHTDRDPQIFSENGIFEILLSDWMQIRAEGDCKKLICMIQGSSGLPEGKI